MILNISNNSEDSVSLGSRLHGVDNMYPMECCKIVITRWYPIIWISEIVAYCAVL